MTSQVEFQAEQMIDGRYQVTRLLGSGAHGTVYLAKDTELDREVAVKVLHAVSIAGWGDELRQRFFREAKALSQLKHRYIISVHRIGVLQTGQPFLVMEYVPGKSLKAEIEERGCLSVREATNRCLQVAQALHHAHSEGIVHRDVKPENITVIDTAGEVTTRLLDFGLSSLQQGQSRSTLTRTGSLLGTPMYVSPEQCRGEQADARSDVYSLGCVFFEMVAGRPPFQIEDIADAMMKHLNQPIPDLVTLDPSAGLPPLLQEVLAKATAKNKADRYPSMQEFIDDLKSIAQTNSAARFTPVRLEQQPETASRKRLPAAMVMALGLLAFIPLSFVAAIAFAIWQPTAFTDATAKVLPAPVASSMLLHIAEGIRSTSGVVAAKSFAHETIKATAYRSWSDVERLTLSAGYFDMFKNNADSAGVDPFAVETIENALDCNRSGASISGQIDRSVEGAAATVGSGNLSREQWLSLVRMFDASYHSLLDGTSSSRSIVELRHLYITASDKVPDYKGQVSIRRMKDAGLHRDAFEDITTTYQMKGR